jgi:hypothetical protein
MGLEQHPGGGLTLWSYRLVAPYTFERTDLPEHSAESLAEGQVLLRFLAAGICGSDLPGFAVHVAGCPATPARAPRRWTASRYTKWWAT